MGMVWVLPPSAKNKRICLPNKLCQKQIGKWQGVIVSARFATLLEDQQFSQLRLNHNSRSDHISADIQWSILSSALTILVLICLSLNTTTNTSNLYTNKVTFKVCTFFHLVLSFWDYIRLFDRVSWPADYYTEAASEPEGREREKKKHTGKERERDRERETDREEEEKREREKHTGKEREIDRERERERETDREREIEKKKKTIQIKGGRERNT